MASGTRTVIVVSTRGGVYSTNPAMAGLDHQESYLKTVFGFFGITDVQVVRAVEFLLEYDRGTEGLSTLAGKLAAYEQLEAERAALIAEVAAATRCCAAKSFS